MPEKSVFLRKKLILDENMAYLVGVILGDGHISNSNKSKTDFSKDYRIVIENVDYGFLKIIEKIIKQFILTKSTVKPLKKRTAKQQSYYFQVRNKQLYYFLIDKMQIPAGKKSDILRVPEQIFRENINIKKHLVAGIFDSDGGFRRNSLGFTMSNLLFQKDVCELLTFFKLDFSKDDWFNKHTNKNYYGVTLRREFITKFLNEIPLRNPEKLKRINMRGCRSGQTGQIISFKKKELVQA